MTDLKFYESKDGPAGDALDYEARLKGGPAITADELSRAYVRQLQIWQAENPELAMEYVGESNTKAYTESKSSGDQLDVEVQKYMQTHSCDYQTAVSEVLRENPQLAKSYINDTRVDRESD